MSEYPENSIFIESRLFRKPLQNETHKIEYLSICTSSNVIKLFVKEIHNHITKVLWHQVSSRNLQS